MGAVSKIVRSHEGVYLIGWRIDLHTCGSAPAVTLHSGVPGRGRDGPIDLLTYNDEPGCLNPSFRSHSEYRLRFGNEVRTPTSRRRRYIIAVSRFTAMPGRHAAVLATPIASDDGYDRTPSNMRVRAALVIGTRGSFRSHSKHRSC
jgi:hypothetical protein